MSINNKIYSTIKQLISEGFIVEKQEACFILIKSGTKVYLWFSGRQAWYLKDRRHREGNKPAVIHPDGHQEFWKNGKQYWP